MLSTLATSIVAALTALLPLLSTAGEQQIASIITLLINLIPALTNELASLVTPVKNIIAALQTNSSVTADQMTALQSLDAQCDATFEAAAAAAGAPSASS